MRASEKDFTFDVDSHIGRYNGDPWPSVTQLLQEERLIDYSGVPEDVLERKRLIGIRVHAATCLIDDCNLDEEHFNKSFPECIPYLEAYRKFRVVEQFEPQLKEDRLISKKWRFHGAPDESGFHVCKHGNDTALIDYKTTWVMFKSTGVQLAGYEMLLKENHKITIKKRIGLLLLPSGNYELVFFKDPRDMLEFQACLVLHWARREKHKTQNGVWSNGQWYTKQEVS